MRELVSRLQMVPYVEGAGSWAGMDCWGLVEIYYREWLDVELTHREGIAPGTAGLQAGFDAFAAKWEKIPTPENHCLVIMRSQGKIAGHVGVYWNGGVLHIEKLTGCVYQPFDSRVIALRVTSLYRYKR